MTDETKAEKALREGVEEALEHERPSGVASMLQTLTYEVEDGKFDPDAVKWGSSKK